MNFEEYDNTIFIVNDNTKKRLLKIISSTPILLNIKVITLSELKKKWFFDYTKEAIYYLSKKENIISDIAEIYIENMYYLRDVNDEKIQKLILLKQNLIEHKLLKTSPHFHNYLKNKTIVLYNLKYIDTFYKGIFDELNKVNKIITYDSISEGAPKELHRAKNKEDEIAFVASSIVKLIKKGIDINNIYLSNVTNDYYLTIKKTFKEFNIPVELPSVTNINSTLIVKKFKSLFSNNLECVFEELKSLVKTKNDEKIYKRLLDIVNEYSFIDDYLKVKEMIFSDIDNIKTPILKLKNAVRVMDFQNELVKESDYVFLINFNQGIIPNEYKDEDYFSDKIKKKLSISTSIDLNKQSTSLLKEKIKSIKNMVVTCAKYDSSRELYISNAYCSDLFIEREIETDYTLSNAFNKRVLTSRLDQYKKFGVVSNELKTLANHYDIEAYSSYNNSYKGVSIEKIRGKLQNKLCLSYTSMNTYYLCGFRYYLDYILKMNKYEDSFQAIIGSVFHSVLSVAFLPDFNFEACWNNLINNIKYKFNNMEKFFLESLKEELLLVIDTIKNQLEYTSLKKSFYEEEVQIEVDKSVNLYFKGFIDKVLYDEFDGVTYAVIIDYKTGSADLSFGGIPYGLNMQLPVYIYLLKNSNKIKNVRIGGFYLQKILDNIRDKDKRIDSLKLTGYTNSDISVIEKVDSSYCSSQVIKSLKTTSTGFSSYSKLISDEEMNRLSKIVNEKIVEASKNIFSSKFDINPKELDGKLVGCSFCKYRDICFMKNDDIIKLNSVTREELFGGEENA